jgi:beta-glucosidase
MRDLRVSSPTFDGDQTLTVQIAVENTGSRSGSEVVQLYIAPPKGHLGRPPQELKAFQKVTLGPGESVAVTFELDHRSFACWNPGQADWDDITSRVPNIVSGMPGAVIAPRHPAGWLAEPGRYEVRVGRSSRHILLTTSVEINELTDS